MEYSQSNWQKHGPTTPPLNIKEDQDTDGDTLETIPRISKEEHVYTDIPGLLQPQLENRKETAANQTWKEYENRQSFTASNETDHSLHNCCPSYQHCTTLTGFKYPWGIAVTGNSIVVAEWGGNCVTIVDSQGDHRLSFGNKEKEQLINPWGVAVTSDKHILVTDSSRVLKYTMEGKLVKHVGGTKGANQQQLDIPAGMAIHPHNRRLYVADSNNHRVQILKQDLSFHSSFGGKGSQRGKFYLPWDVAVDSQGIVYVTEGNNRIQAFTPDGQFLTVFGEKGTKAGEINRPASITIDSNDIIHISDLYNHSITMFNTSGQVLGCYGNHNMKGSVSFKGPCGTAVMNNNTLYVVDSWNNSVEIFKY